MRTAPLSWITCLLLTSCTNPLPHPSLLGDGSPADAAIADDRAAGAEMTVGTEMTGGDGSNTGWRAVPSPTSATLFAGWGPSGDDLWVVGAGGTILHYDGSSWELRFSPTTQDLLWVWGSSATDIWAVGAAGTCLRYRGSAWEPLATGVSQQLDSVWGSSAPDVWAVGRSGTILHHDGAGWSKVASPSTRDLFSVWGSSASAVWVVGAAGTILAWDAPGQAWLVQTSPTSKDLYEIWGRAGALWAVGTDRVIAHDGQAWIKETIHGDPSLRALGGPPDEAPIWAAGDNGVMFFRGSPEWTQVPAMTTAALRDVFGAPDGVLWAVGDQGTILRHDP